MFSHSSIWTCVSCVTMGAYKFGGSTPYPSSKPCDILPQGCLVLFGFLSTTLMFIIILLLFLFLLSKVCATTHFLVLFFIPPSVSKHHHQNQKWNQQDKPYTHSFCWNLKLPAIEWERRMEHKLGNKNKRKSLRAYLFSSPMVVVAWGLSKLLFSSSPLLSSSSPLWAIKW